MIFPDKPEPPVALEFASIKRALVLVPHPDDEAIGCGGLLALLADQGAPVRVVLVSDGSGAGGLPEGSAEKRLQEFIASLSTLGSTISYECWMLPDGSLSQCEDLVTRLANSVSCFEPTLLVAPWLHDIHPDHAVVGRSALNVSQLLGMQQGVLFYEVWSPVPANLILNISSVWSRKKSALLRHLTALQCGHYVRAMEGLASYRSLLSGQLAADGEYAEAFYAVGWRPSVEGESGWARYATQGDAESIAALHREVFDSEVSAQWWLWKYAAQQIFGTVFEKHQKIVGFYGALERVGFWKGKEVSVSQQADVMVSAADRFGTRRNGVFANMSRLLLVEHLGHTKKYGICFGFPSIRALHLGIRLGLYEQADSVFIGTRRLSGWRKSALFQHKKLQPAATVKDFSWLAALPVHTAPGEFFWLKKDGGYWRWRFAEHPDKQYLVLRVFVLGRLVAAAVLLRSGESLEIVDYALKSWRHLQALQFEIENTALDLELDKVSIWGTINLLESFSFSETDVVHAGYLALPGKILDFSLSHEIKGKTWFIGGDTDFR